MFDLPYSTPCMRIGLLGGSFNPPHLGHMQVSYMALQRLQLSCIWWLVTPQNPFKLGQPAPDVATRVGWARSLAQEYHADPWLRITGIELFFSSHYTYDTLRHLQTLCPSVHFVWLMGSDVWESFHLWYRWRDVAQRVPLAIMNRPSASIEWEDQSLPSSLSRYSFCHKQPLAAQTLAAYRLNEREAPQLANRQPPIWTFLRGPMSFLSSSALRESGMIPSSIRSIAPKDPDRP